MIHKIVHNRWVTQLALLSACLWIGLVGCSFISDGERQEKLNNLDEDGDGYVAQPVDGSPPDCEPQNPNVYPGNLEVPYDGWDNDCAGGDLVDVDGDGYPGISKEDYLANNPDTNQPWPPVYEGKETDCDDDDGDVNHGNLDDPAYDGIDANCDGSNDYDFDGDMDMPAHYTLRNVADFLVQYETEIQFLQYVEEWGYTHLLDTYATGETDADGGAVYWLGDCDDADEFSSSKESAEDDIPYDGVDKDCAGNNDFDVDGDGWMPVGYEIAYTQYLEKYFGGEEPEHWDTDYPLSPPEWGDCLDGVNENINADPEDVNEGVALSSDFPYDGIDQNCDQVNDFDADGDGYMPDKFPNGTPLKGTSIFQDYMDAWGYDGLYMTSCMTFGVGGKCAEYQYGDCDDENEDIRPGAFEKFGDEVDQDCNGTPTLEGNDSAPFQFGGLRWSNPRSPRVDRTDDNYILATMADYIDVLTTEYTDAGMAFVFEEEVEVGEDFIGYGIPWLNLGDAVGYGVDLITDGADFWLSGTYWEEDLGPVYKTFQIVRHYFPELDQFMEPTGAYVSDQSNGMAWSTETGVSGEPREERWDIDVAKDSMGRVWSLACGETSIQFAIKQKDDTTETETVWDDINEDDIVDPGETWEQEIPVGYIAFEAERMDLPYYGDVSCFLDITHGDAEKALGMRCHEDGCDEYELFLSRAEEDPNGTDPSVEPIVSLGVSSIFGVGHDVISSNTREGVYTLVTADTAGIQLVDYDWVTVTYDSYELLDDNTNLMVISADAVAYAGAYYIVYIEETLSSGVRKVKMAYFANGLSNGITGDTAVFVFDDTENGRVLVPEQVSIFVDYQRMFIAVSGSDESAPSALDDACGAITENTDCENADNEGCDWDEDANACIYPSDAVGWVFLDMSDS